ncbi:hypothetical protein [Algibacter sp. L1A34]|uniref:hypothetical protein n=1 Tax=Algibacter sp. L1A34 TaxID=2686365 RepID=UPI00131EB6F6|nr:hypothetical protein [Algibacter sp. L1A34]
MKLINTILKATGLSTFIFWTIIFSQNFELDMFPFILLSFIPIFICNTIVIALTIAPFFLSKNNKTTARDVFQKYFPYYAIISFSLCSYGLIQSKFAICFFVAAFISSLQSWVWLIKDIENIKPQIQDLL